MTKIAIVDPHPAFRDSLGMMLHEFLAEIQITGVETSQQFVSDLDQISPDLVIIDSRLPDRSGIETAIIALAKKPLLHIIMLIMFPEDQYVQKARKAGVKGFLPKPPGLKELRDACDTVMSGGSYFPAEIKMP
ncbi:response regulator [Kaistella faecalis]|uniref:response regulator n=1 Tax=Kaistella faecalis TaxID=2852098 RepID=UPI001C48C881|nr:response regulator transcription factor [Chryseobacterium faecale]UFK97854.1 response regulator transcription factor [Chryseobacterium faecale]